MPKFQDYEKTAKEYKIGGGEFWKLDPGMNRIRILSQYEVYGSHWIDADRRSYACIGQEEGCEYCKRGSKVSPIFLMWVFDRGTKSVRLLQTGYQIIKQLGALANSEDWVFEEVPDYDITINKKGQKKDTEYFVQPTPSKVPLTKEEMDLAKETMTDLKEMISRMKEKVGGSASVVSVDDGYSTEDNIEPTDDQLNNPLDSELPIENIPF